MRTMMNRNKAAKLVLKAAARRGISAKGGVLEVIPQVMAVRNSIYRLMTKGGDFAPQDIVPIIAAAKALLNNPAIFSQPAFSLGTDTGEITRSISDIVYDLRKAYQYANKQKPELAVDLLKDAAQHCEYLVKDIRRYAQNRSHGR